MNQSYHIIDEPKKTGKERLVVNPLIILFACIFIPILITLPFFGKFWMPFVWLLANGYFLGSATWKKEWAYSAGGIAIMFVLFVVLSMSPLFGISDNAMNILAPYLPTVLNALLFLSLYVVVFTQSTSYELHQYIHGKED